MPESLAPEESRLQRYLQEAVENNIEWIALRDVAAELDVDESTVEEAMGKLERHPSVEIERDTEIGVVGWYIDPPS